MDKEEFEDDLLESKHAPTDEYKKHNIFDELIQYAQYYDSLGYSTFQWTSVGTKGLLNFDSQIFASMKGTLESIYLLLQHGKINDSFSLTRKFQDVVVINIYAILYLDDNYSLDNLIVEKINNWVQGKEKLPEYGVMNNYIKKSKQLKTISELIFINPHYKGMRQRLNDHTHYNDFKYMFYNTSGTAMMYSNGVALLTQLSHEIRNIFIMHFIWLFTVRGNYMMSGDYMDYMDCGDMPPENSQNWVAPFIQKIFDDVVKIYRPDLVEEFKNSTSMEIH